MIYPVDSVIQPLNNQAQVHKRVTDERDQYPLILESPSNLTGPKSYFEIEVSRKLGCVLASNEVHFVSLAENFTV